MIDYKTNYDKTYKAQVKAWETWQKLEARALKALKIAKNHGWQPYTTTINERNPSIEKYLDLDAKTEAALRNYKQATDTAETWLELMEDAFEENLNHELTNQPALI